jgi:pimeloyl-ACP methyl ester carboxylesterase
MTRVNQHVTLSDGRMLGYNEYGPVDGKPLFYFHGTPSSRSEWQMLGSEQLATQLHLRVISMDRPWMGLSDFQASRRLGDWPTDVVALADELGKPSADHIIPDLQHIEVGTWIPMSGKVT